MPDSTISLRAQELMAVVCNCLLALDLTECECFHGNETDFCCEVYYGWAGGQELNCSGPFANFIGSQINSEYGAPCGPQRQIGEFQVGYALCLPEPGNNRAAYLRKYGEFTECLQYMAEEIWKCLSALLCCDNASAGDVVSVEGIETEENRFVITVGVVL